MKKDFNERQIPTKARPIQMNNDLLENCKKEIEDLLIKGLIRKASLLGIVLLFMLINRKNWSKEFQDWL